MDQEEHSDDDDNKTSEYNTVSRAAVIISTDEDSEEEPSSPKMCPGARRCIQDIKNDFLFFVMVFFGSCFILFLVILVLRSDYRMYSAQGGTLDGYIAAIVLAIILYIIAYLI